MAINAAYAGEDVPITISYVDSSDNPVDVDDPTSGPTITITDESDSEVVSGTVMSNPSTGEYEHVWDTATNASGTGDYTVEITGEFSSETKISRKQISLR